MRAATEALRFRGVRILANFKHFRKVEFASGKCPHLAIRDRLNLREGRGRNIIVALTRSVMHKSVTSSAEKGGGLTYEP
jgi:hypothetical protein